MLKQVVFNSSVPNMQPTFSDQSNFVPKDFNALKRKLTLNLNFQGVKKPKFGENILSPILSSPDLMMLKIGTPEIEKILLDQQNNLLTIPPSSEPIFYSGNLIKEEDKPDNGFVGAHSELLIDDLSPGGNLPVSSNNTYASLDPQFHTNFSFYRSQDESVVKDEPQSVPDILPSLSPIDMDNQEVIKLERKRQRNRIAATRCRKKKLEKIALLEEKVNVLRSENAELTEIVKRLKDDVYYLKQQTIEHVKSGCNITLHFETV